MKLRELQEIFAFNITNLIKQIYGQGFTCTLGEAWRPPEMAKIYEREGKGIFHSLHCDRLALDINLFKDGKYLSESSAHKPFGDIWEGMHENNRWGGRYKDGNHYEMLLKKRE